MAAAELTGRLRLLAILVRFMEANSDTPPSANAVHPAMPLLQLAYPALEAVAGSAALQADEQVYNALCEVLYPSSMITLLNQKLVVMQRRQDASSKKRLLQWNGKL